MGDGKEDSSPLHLLTWSPAWRPPLGHPNMKHCLEIQVTLAELGDMPPPLFLGWPHW